MEVIWNNNTEFLERQNQKIEESYAFPSDNISDFTNFIKFECLNDQNFWSEWKEIILLLGYPGMDNFLLLIIIPLLGRVYFFKVFMGQ